MEFFFLSAGQSSTNIEKRRKSNRKDIVAIKDGNGQLITDSIKKANSLNVYYSSVFSSERRIAQIQCATSCVRFAINTKIIRLAATCKNFGRAGQRFL
jgi:hypothetical protein